MSHNCPIYSTKAKGQFFLVEAQKRRENKRHSSIALLIWSSLVLRPSITANAVEGLVKLLHRMTSGGRTVDVWWTQDAWRHGTFGKPQSQVQSKVKTGTIVDRRSTTEQSEFTIRPPHIHLTSFYIEVPPR